MALPSKLLRINAVISRHGVRAYHDLHVHPDGKPVVSQGPPGYSAMSGHVVTVFGCTGFLGRYVVSKLAKMGTQVVVPYRDEDEKRHLKPMGDLGQIVSLEWDIRNEQQIAECVRHSDTVFNFVGRDYETKNFSYHDIHTKGAERIAKITAESGVSKFFHLSHLNASLDSKSSFYQSKAEGEERVRAAFPNATIVRPGPMYGHEDRLLNSMAVYPTLWKFNNHGDTRIRPVHVFDVAQALVNLMDSPRLYPEINLPGPSTFTHEWMLELVESVTLRQKSAGFAVPKSIAMLLSRLAQVVWWPTVSPDEIERQFIDDLDRAGDWAVTGVTPVEIEEKAITYLRRYRSSDDYLRPVKFPPPPVLE